MSLYFMHYRRPGNGDYSTHGGATVAIQPISEEKAIVSIARCSDLDVFNKKIGRTVAAGRLTAYTAGKEFGPHIIREVAIDDEQGIKNAVGNALAIDMIKEGYF